MASDPASGEHRRAFVASLEGLTIEVRAFGNSVLLLLHDASELALRRQPATPRLRALFRDLRADADHLEAECFELLARQQPVAGDLRGIVCALWVVQELFDAGIDAIEVTEELARGESGPPALPPRVGGLLELMAAQASVELSLVLDAFTDGSLALADALRDVDDVMNGLLRDLIRAVTQDPGADEAGVAGLVQAVLAARILERIGNGAVDCADRIRFWLTGATPTTRDEDPVVPTR